MKKKIKITRDKYEKISKLYRFGGFAIIVGLLISFSSLIGKPVEFLLIFLPYFLTKGLYSRQFHSRSLKECFSISLVVFALALMACVPSGASIMFSVILGLAIAFVSYKIGMVQTKLKDYDYIEPRYNQLVEFYKDATAPKPFSVDTCTEQELRLRCSTLHLSHENTELAVEFFIRKTKQSIIADKLCIDEKSVTTRKKRLKAKLNNN
jgi:hypothetical protein